MIWKNECNSCASTMLLEAIWLPVLKIQSYLFYWRNSQHIVCSVCFVLHRMEITETLKMVIVFYYQLLSNYCTYFISYSQHMWMLLLLLFFSMFLRMKIIKTAHCERRGGKTEQKTLNFCFCFLRLFICKILPSTFWR